MRCSLLLGLRDRIIEMMIKVLGDIVNSRCDRRATSREFLMALRIFGHRLYSITHFPLLLEFGWKIGSVEI
jgi:hypothetical protein